MKIEIANKTAKKIEGSFVRRVIRKTLKISGKSEKKAAFSVVFLGKKEIQSLNRMYRKKNKPTDVLSFDFASGYNKKRGKGKTDGEIVLSPEMIAVSAKSNKVTFSRELAFVLSHGVLHLLGMEHGKKMFDAQDEICKCL